jgi:hypothetical protein
LQGPEKFDSLVDGRRQKKQQAERGCESNRRTLSESRHSSPKQFSSFPIFGQELVDVRLRRRSQVRAKTPFEAGSGELFRKDRFLLLRSLKIWLNAKLIPFQTLSQNRGEANSTVFTREFDPGSESTLAARLTHASRTRKWSNP